MRDVLAQKRAGLPSPAPHFPLLSKPAEGIQSDMILVDTELVELRSAANSDGELIAQGDNDGCESSSRSFAKTALQPPEIPNVNPKKRDKKTILNPRA